MRRLMKVTLNFHDPFAYALQAFGGDGGDSMDGAAADSGNAATATSKSWKWLTLRLSPPHCQ
jgi:hypothetical protein